MRSALGLGVLLVLAAGCGGGERNYSWTGLDEASGHQMNLQRGPMPAGQTFTGVYRSPQIGDIQIAQTGEAVVGVYEYDRGSCHVHARIEGTTQGNLLKFNWREDHRECGRIEPVVGHGFFLYAMDEGEIPRGRLFGRWGYAEDDREGGPYTAFKVPNRAPTFQQSGEGGSSGGENTGGENSGGEGTSSGGEGGSSGGESGGGNQGGGSSGGGRQGGGGGNLGI
jgi:hypothetical protein